MDINNIINEHLNQFDFDIRKSRDARFVDQKCTPDIVCFIADCILNLIATKPIFVINDLWETQFFILNSRVIFNKPWANDKNAYNEYNKVLSQPLKLLAYARVLGVSKVNGSLTFYVQNEELLDYIARKDINAFNFLYYYFTKVLDDSNFMKHIEEYQKNWMRNLDCARKEVYDQYYRLINGNTPSHSVLDITRMFHKVFNIIAVKNGTPGSKGKHPMMYSDLMYNRVNSRDILFYKEKTMSRKEAHEGASHDTRADEINSYYMQKAIGLIRKIHTRSEVHDVWAYGEATQVHHIFPRSQYPEIAHYVENLILLTATQHNTKAHPKNNTQIIDPNYQMVCLLSKADTIQNSLELYGDKYYRKESFINVVNTGLDLDISSRATFPDIKQTIHNRYSE